MTKLSSLHKGSHVQIARLKVFPKDKVTFMDITETVANVVKKSGIKNGVAHVFSRHTTCGVRINENEEGLMRDFNEHLDYLVPPHETYHHDNFEERICPLNEPKNACAHIANLFMGAGETIPVYNGKMLLGRWQSIFFVDLDGGRPKGREVIITITR